MQISITVKYLAQFMHSICLKLPFVIILRAILENFSITKNIDDDN